MKIHYKSAEIVKAPKPTFEDGYVLEIYVNGIGKYNFGGYLLVPFYSEETAQRILDEFKNAKVSNTND